MVATVSAFNISQMIKSPLVVPMATHSTGFEECPFRYRTKLSKSISENLNNDFSPAIFWLISVCGQAFPI